VYDRLPRSRLATTRERRIDSRGWLDRHEPVSVSINLHPNPKRARNNMRTSISASVVAAGLVVSALAVQPPSALGGESLDESVERPSQPYFAFCRSDKMIGNTFYFTATRRIDAGVGRQDLQKSFHEHLATKFKYPNTSGVSCVSAAGGDLQARTESSRQQTIKNLHSAHYDVVETDWTYRK
jgi:hypothetical protein